MAEAIAEVTSHLATKTDLAALKGDLESHLALFEQRMTIKFGGMIVRGRCRLGWF